MNCLIVDDSIIARTSLRELISRVETLTLKHECSSAIEVFNILQKEEIDLVFLDVEMPEMTGIEFLKKLEKRPITILITGKREYAVEGFELNVVDYIVKPVTLSRLMVAVSRAKEVFDVSHSSQESFGKEYIFIRDKGVLSKIKVVDILFVHALGSYVSIHTAEKRYTIHHTLLAIAENLPSEKFYRLHRSYLIALDKVDKVEQETAYIGKTPIPIGELYKKTFLEKLNLI